MENCRSCKQFRPFKARDKHDLCPKCRPCGSKQTCSICQDWAQERWDLIGTWLADKAVEKRKKAASSRQGKKKPPANREAHAAIRDGISPKHGGTEGAIGDGSNPPQERVSIRDGANSRAASAQPRPRPQEGPSTSGHVESRSPRRQAVADLLTSTPGSWDHNRRDFSGFSPESTERRQSRTESTGQQGAPSIPPQPALPPAPVTDDHAPEEAQVDPWDDVSSRTDDALSIAASARLLSGDSEADDEEPLRGTEISAEAFKKATAVLRRVLGFEERVDARAHEGPASKLTLNAAAQKPRASIPVDVECRERFEAVAQAKRWTAFQRSAHRTFHVGDEDWESLFTPPHIPPQVKERLRSAGALDGKDKFREKGAQTLESSLFDVDRASRAGMKYTSALLLFAELLNRSFQQAQASGISRKDTAAIIALLGPVSRMVLDQFARVSVKATLTRRDLVLNSLNWSSRSTADGFRNLPILGCDLFGGKFDEKLREEAERMKSLREADEHMSRSASSSRPRYDSRQGSRLKQPRSSYSQSRGAPRTQQQSAPSRPEHRPYRQQYRGSRGRGKRPYGCPPHRNAQGQGGGRLRVFGAHWEEIDPGAWVLDVVKGGYKIEFSSTPPQYGLLTATPVPEIPEKRAALEDEINSLLKKGAITRVTAANADGPLFRSSFFLTPKKNGTWRPIVNLRPLNRRFIRPERFRMETLTSILHLLRPGMWASSVDLKHAYLHIPIRSEDQRFLAFRYKAIDYRFTSLPFGLSTAPRVSPG
ncbi:uncharacterized protein [Apostichopus japonicus]|uniref:uncharacterized protein n=1 Tax=Stichopus japonicus TaxID=307972 RepID=UPI003AB53F59